MIYLILALLLSSCTTIQPNTPTTPCHGEELPTGSCPDSSVLDMDGTACHHKINCGSYIN